MSRQKITGASTFDMVSNKVLGTLKAFGVIEVRAEKKIEKYKKDLEKWLMKTAVIGLSIFMSLAFLVMGLFFIAIDYGGLPRGVVFTCGGGIGLLFLWFKVSGK